MDNKVLIAIVAVVAVVAAACGAVVLLNHGGNGGETDSSILNVDSSGTINGGTYQSVIISPSVGDGTVILKSVKILGDLIIRGGGSHTVELDSCEVDGTTTVEKEGGEAPRILANNTQMASVNVKTDAIIESTGTGGFDNVTTSGGADVTVQGSETKVENIAVSQDSTANVTGGSVSNLNMSDGSNVNVSGGEVSAVNVAQDSTVGVQIGESGNVQTVVVADNVTMNTTGDSTKDKLEETDLKMADGATTTSVTIGNESVHVHAYEATFDWAADGKTCTVNLVCKTDASHKESLDGTVTSSVKVPPTCTEKGTTAYTVSVSYGGNQFTDTKDVQDLPARGHEYVVDFVWAEDYSSASYVANCTHDKTHIEQGFVDAQVQTTPATCTEDGSSVYTVSVDLSDGNHSESETVVLPKTHHYQVESVDFESITEDEETGAITIEATLVCDVCDAQTENHSVSGTFNVKDEGEFVAPDCGQGIDGHASFVIIYEGNEYPYTEVFPAEHHYLVNPQAGVGDREHPHITILCIYCQDTKVIEDAVPHISDRVEPTCTQVGSYKYYAEGTYDGDTYSTYEETVLLNPLGHDYQFNWEWGQNNTTATLIVTCARDGCEFQADCRAEVEVNSTATCTQAGDTVYTATAYFLNEAKTDTKNVSGEPLGHNYHLADTDWQTFDKNALTVIVTKVCSRCEEGEVGHSVTESATVSVRVTPATCTVEGNNHYYVESPQENGYNEVIPALGHNCQYTFEWSQDFASAIMHEVCTRDGCDYSKDYQASVNSVTTPSTCRAAGKIVYTATCTSDDGVQHTDTKTVTLPLAEHTYTITEIHWNTLDQEDMTVEVVKVCSVCEDSDEGHTVTQAVDVLVQTTPATCDEAGKHHYYVEGTQLDGYDVPIPAGAHQLTHHAGQAATCTEAGWEEFDTCSLCGYSTFAEIPKLGHDLIHHDAKAPTVSEPGWEEYDTCSRCDYTTYVEIPAIHGYTITVYGGLVAEKGQEATVSRITVPENTVVTVEYTGSDFSVWLDSYGHFIPGETFDILVACDLYVTAHDVTERVYGDWVHESEPDCENDGVWYRPYGELREYRTIPALGHISDNHLVVDTSATCTVDGIGHTTCERCLGEIEQVIEATGHSYVFTPEVEANGSIIGKMKGECSECDHTILKDYIVPIYPSGNIVVTFDQYHPNGSKTTSDRDEIHTMWKFTDAQDVERQAYLYQIQRDIHTNGYISGMDVTTWVFWADYGVHSPVYIARHNDTTPVYGGANNSASWAVAGYVDNLEEFVYFLDHLSAEVTIGGEEFYLTLGMDNGAHASDLFDLYNAWANVFNAGFSSLYEVGHTTYRGWECTVYSNEYETYYVNEDNCCVYWGSELTADRLEIKSIEDVTTAPFTYGYWNSDDFPLFSSYYFNRMPTLDNSTYFCIKLINGEYNSADFTVGGYNRVDFFNGDSIDHVMWIEPTLYGHQALSDIQVLSKNGVWVSVPYLKDDGHYVFDIQDRSIIGLYTYMIEQYPGDFVLPNNPAFNGVYIRCVIADADPDSTVTVTGGTYTNAEYDEVSTGQVYGGQYIYLTFDEIIGKALSGITVTVNGGEPQTIGFYYSYLVPEDSTVTIVPIYIDVDTVHVEIICTEGGSADKVSGDYNVGFFQCTATAHFGYIFDGWYEVIDGEEFSASTYETLWKDLQKNDGDRTFKAVFKPVSSATLADHNYTKVTVTDGFIHYGDEPVYVTALYGNPEYSGMMYVHADPNRDAVYRWDMKSYAEDPNSQTIHMYPSEEWFDGNVKYCGQLTIVDAVFEDDLSFYNLTYDLNGADGSIEGGAYTGDEEVYIPGTEWEGHNFLGWNTARDGSGTTYNAGEYYLLEADLVLYAQWEVLSKDINLFGPSNAPYTFDMAKKNISVRWGETVNVPEGVLTVYGCDLIGWDIEINGETQRIGVTGAIPYDAYAIVRAVVGNFDEYRIHFESGDVTPDNTMEDIVFKVTDISNLQISWSSSTNFTKAGYKLSGWTCNVDGDAPSVTSLPVTNRIKTAGYEDGGTFTLTAQWTKVTYVFDFKKGTAPAGATVSGNGERVEFVCDDTFTFTISPSKMFTCSGYTLAGFNTSSGMTVYLYEYGQTVDTNVLLANPNLSFGSTAYGLLEELYPVWAKNEYTVYFYSEPGSNYPYEQQMSYGSSANLAAVSTMGAAFEREGYILVGWITDDGRTFEDGESVKNLTLTGSVSLYAVWMHDTYTVHFDKNADDATGEMADQTFSANEEKGLTPNAFAMEGYVFVRWCTNEYNQGEYYANGQSVCNITYEESITLYAIWEEEQSP